MPPGLDFVDRPGRAGIYDFAVTKNKVEIMVQRHSEELAGKQMALSDCTRLGKFQSGRDD